MPLRSGSRHRRRSPDQVPDRDQPRGRHRRGRRHLIIARCTSAEQRTASTTLGNSASIPSPVFLTVRPWCSLTFGSTSSRRWAWSRSCVPSSSAPINRLYPATSAARIAARRRVAGIPRETAVYCRAAARLVRPGGGNSAVCYLGDAAVAWLVPRLADCCAILSFRSPSRPRGRGQPTPPRPEFCRCHL